MKRVGISIGLKSTVVAEANLVRVLIIYGSLFFRTKRDDGQGEILDKNVDRGRTAILQLHPFVFQLNTEEFIASKNLNTALPLRVSNTGSFGPIVFF